MALTKIGTDGVKDDAVTSGKIPANAIGASELAPNSVSLNHLGQGSSATDGKFLRANNGADPTFETVNTDLVSDTSPQLGGDLDSNGHNIKITDGEKLKLGDGNDGELYHDGHHTYLKDVGTGNLRLAADDAIFIQKNTGGETVAKFIPDGAVELYHDNTKVFETGADRIFAKARFNINADGINSGDGIGFGQWDGSNHRIEGDSNRPMFITSYNSSGIKLGASGAVKATVTNNGLTFNGDTAAANALDDYEEGSWTPVVLDQNGSNYSINVSTNDTYYTKIGRLVNLMFSITNAETGSKTGYLYIPTSAFPFTPAKGSQNGSFWVDHGNPTTGLGDIVGGIMNIGTSGAWFTKPTDESGMGYASSRYLQHGQWSYGRPIYGHFQFITS